MGSDDENLASYLAEVQRLPGLTPVEEREEREWAWQGDEEARRRVVEGYLERTALLALRVAPDWMPPLDAIQEANVVLSRLVDDARVEALADRLEDAVRAHFAEVGRQRGE